MIDEPVGISMIYLSLGPSHFKAVCFWVRLFTEM